MASHARPKIFAVVAVFRSTEAMIAEAPNDEEHAHGGAPGGMGGMRGMDI